MICLVCLKNDTHRYACGDCSETARRRLRELELFAERLAIPAMLEPTRGTTGRRSPGYGSRSPARDDVLVMLDHRSHAERLGQTTRKPRCGPCTASPSTCARTPTSSRRGTPR